MAGEGKVIQVIGPVVDVEFDESALPPIYQAIRVVSDGFDVPDPINVLVEIQQHLGEGRCRCVAPTSVFNLFGLLPFDPGAVPGFGPFLLLGVWPLIMGVTMFLQMRMNPTPPDPTQAMIFTWMPVIFTFMLASFPAGLVIYWAWNNTLSIIQQGIIMKRQGAKIELWDNLKSMFKSKPKPAE